jgi:hypothetical protein
MSIQHRTATQLSGRLNRHLSQYALAASAAGLGVLALAQPADAKIVYTRVTVLLTSPYELDLNRDGISDFEFHISQFGSSSFLVIRPKSKNLFWETDNAPAALDAGVSVHSSIKLHASHNLMCKTSDYSDWGPWYNVPNHYLGLKFYVKGKAHYGWARLKTTACHATLTGYAYETIPNKPIITGKTKGPDVITVQPGSLGALAAGAAGRSGK